MDVDVLILLTILGDISIEATLIENSTNQSWIMAHKFCKSKGARMLTSSDIGWLKDNSSDIYRERFWLGSYKARTDFLTEIGCYYVREEIEFSPIRDAKMNGPKCFFYCIQNKSFTTYFIALQGMSCVCILKEELPEGTKLTIGCQTPCSDGSVCGGKGLYSIYRIEHSLEYELSKGFCVGVTHPFKEMKMMSCRKKSKYYCKGKYARDDEIQYVGLSDKVHNVKARQARRTCANIKGYQSNFSLAEIEDFSEGRISDYSQDETYWISTRVYLTDLVANDILVNPPYLYRCTAWIGTDEKEFGCKKHGEKVKCVRDFQHLGTTQSMKPELSTSQTYGNSKNDAITSLNEKDNKEDAEKEDITLIISVSGALIFIFIVIVTVFIVFRRKRFKKRTEKTSGTNESNKSKILASNPTTSYIIMDSNEENYVKIRESSIQVNTNSRNYDATGNHGYNNKGNEECSTNNKENSAETTDQD